MGNLDYVLTLPRREQLAWAAGLFEGEGSFSFAQRGTQKYAVIVAELGMTDEDRVRLFHQIVGVGNVTTHPRPLKAHWKTVHIWKVGSFQGTQAVTAMLWPWLGPRRRAKAKTNIQQYLANPRYAGHATDAQVREVRDLLAQGIPKRKVAKMVGRSYGFVNHIKSGRSNAGVGVA